MTQTQTQGGHDMQQHTFGEVLADPASNLHRFVHVEAPKAMAHNPVTGNEWADYFAFLRDNPGCSTQAWRRSGKEG